MNYLEYLALPGKKLITEDIEGISNAAEDAVNSLNYDPREQMIPVIHNIPLMTNAIKIALATIKYEAETQTRIDGRNEQSHDIARKLYETAEYHSITEDMKHTVTQDEKNFYTALARRIGESMHRTNLQQHISWAVYVLGATNPEFAKKAKNITYNEQYWRMPMI